MNFNWDSIKKNLQGNVLGGNKSSEDARIWKLTADKEGNGSAVIRLLPGKEGTPTLIRVYEHNIFLKVEGKWRIYKHISPATIDKSCPVSKAYYELYDANKDANDKYKAILEKIRRSTSFMCNIKVINDLGNDENNGQFKIFKFGKTVFDGIMDLVEPSEKKKALGVKPKEVFNPLEPWNVIVSRTGLKFNTKYSVEAQEGEPLVSSEDEIPALLENTYDLGEFIDPKNIEDYDTLLKDFAKLIVDTEIEDALREINSKVIKEMEEKGYLGAGNTAQSEEVPAQGGVVNVAPKTKTETKTEVKTEQKTETPAPKPEVKEAQDDDLDALLDDL